VKKFFNWLMVLAACVGAFYGIGLIVPRNQTQSSRVDLQTKPMKVMEVIVDVENCSEWVPGVMSVREGKKRDDHPVWNVTKADGKSYDLEVTSETEYSWQATYTIDESHYSVRYKLSGLGEGTRLQVTKTVDTRDPWRRAKMFLFMQGDTSALALLNALAEHLGEAATAKDI
jgi:hypothetical protein